MYKHLSCAAFKTKLTTGSGNAGTCEKLRDRSRIRLRQKSGVCVCVQALLPWANGVTGPQVKEKRRPQKEPEDRLLSPDIILYETCNKA